MAEWIATAAFGLEGLVKQELQTLGFDAKVVQGGCSFEADAEGAFLANLQLRCADRVLMLLKEGEARSYEELFQLVNSIPWMEYLGREGRFPVQAQCARSQLMSPRDVQTISKKAIVEKLKERYKLSWFEESGPEYQVLVSLHSDRVRICLDASGDALNKRGYRTWNGEAPLRETLAAALLQLSPWRPGLPLYDPCCGTGTLLIEAAFMMANRAPGLNRSFAMESWRFVDKAACDAVREEARAQVDLRKISGIAGSDIDPEALRLCRLHIRQAGLEGRIQVEQRDLRQLPVLSAGTVIVCNPPYGERLSTQREAEKLYRDMRSLEGKTQGGRVCALSANPAFERHYGKRANKKRRLYNGRLECEFLIF